MIQAVIMAGGKGTRLLSVTKDEIPKPMAILAGKPVLQWQIECFCRMGITDILIVVGHLGEKIKDFFQDGSRFGVSISYYHEQKPLGTAGALPELAECLEKDFVLSFGDIIFDVDLSRMMQFHRMKNSGATLFVHPNSHPYDSDLVLQGENNCVMGFLSKNEDRAGWYDNCVNAGLYMLDRDICRDIPAGEKTDLEKDVLGALISEGGVVFAYASPEYIKDVGIPARIREAEIEIKRGVVSACNLRRPQKCVFLDRDGTINKYRGLISEPEALELEDTVIEAIKKLNSSGWLAVIITNQPVVARGMCSMEDVAYIHKKLKTLLGEQGAYLDDILFCPHHPDKGYPEENPEYKIECGCRKPGTDLLDLCANRYHIDLSASWMVGDTTVDIQTGINAGTHTALVATGVKGTDKKYDVCPDYTGETLLDVVNYILEEK